MHGPVIPEVSRVEMKCWGMAMTTLIMTLMALKIIIKTLMMTPASIRGQVEPKKCGARPKVTMDSQK